MKNRIKKYLKPEKPKNLVVTILTWDVAGLKEQMKMIEDIIVRKISGKDSHE
jgi:hypothetical protein